MTIKRTGWLALVVLGISPISHIAAEPDAPRRGAFAITLTPGELLGEAAQKTASIIPRDEPISWEVHVPEGYNAESSAGILSGLHSDTVRRHS